MVVKLAAKVIGYSVENKDSRVEVAADSVPVLKPLAEQSVPAQPTASKVMEQMEPVRVEMSENVSRPDTLYGSTYKIKIPVSEHAMYVTINDVVLNEGTDFEQRRPFEIFINSKNLEHYQWIVALTRVISAVFRKGGDVSFLAEELQSVFDPKGGYWQKGKFMPSLVAEIGAVLSKHMHALGMIKTSGLALQARKLVEEKARVGTNVVNLRKDTEDAHPEAIPPHQADISSAKPMKTCSSCGLQSVVSQGGCDVCLDCGNSKCG